MSIHIFLFIYVYGKVSEQNDNHFKSTNVFIHFHRNLYPFSQASNGNFGPGTRKNCKDTSNQCSERKKTQFQLCKRLAGPIIPFSWPNVVWKRISHWMWSLRGSQKPFSCVLGHFRHGDNQTNNRTTNWVRRQSFAIKVRENLYRVHSWQRLVC